MLDCQDMAKTYPGRSHQCQKRKDSEVLLMVLLMLVLCLLSNVVNTNAVAIYE